MKAEDVVKRLEDADYLFVNILEEEEDFAKFSAVDPAGNVMEIEMVKQLVVERSIASQFWDIVFIGEESFL